MNKKLFLQSLNSLESAFGEKLSEDRAKIYWDILKGYSDLEIKKIIDWVVEDKFWAKNILCPASLRKHYPRFYKEIIDRGKSLEEKVAADHRLDNVD